MKKLKKTQSIVVVFLLLISSCKEQFLDAKPNDALVVPETLAELQAILDNDHYLNGAISQGPDPYIGAIGSDDYFITDDVYLQRGDFNMGAYIWSKKLDYDPVTKNWIGPYWVVFYANTVLDLLDKVQSNDEMKEEYDNIKGSALFYRAYQFYNLVQIFAVPYNKQSALNDLGIPLRLNSDISVPTTRSSVQKTYDQIVMDLMHALELLPNESFTKTRPSRLATYALLARVYLITGNYEKALEFSNKGLEINSFPLDYNDIVKGIGISFQRYNQDVLYHSVMSQDHPGLMSAAKIDTILYSSYATNDLRKELFFEYDGKYHNYIGSYTGNRTLFTGLTIGEIYLIKAECQARIGNVAEALQTLNFLLVNRYERDSFVNFNTSDENIALNRILQERRKELVMRNLRWSDLRRLNAEKRFAKTLYRNINGQEYTLPPNDSRYTWPIPDYIIGFTNLNQNP